jgi:formate dehydrogenase maturation protein FdhE
MKELELDYKIWEGAHKWAEAAIEGNWKVRKKSDFLDSHELASSIHSFICKELQIGWFGKNNFVHPKKKRSKKEKCIICGKPMKPDKKSLNYSTKKWDGHTYFPCDCCGKFDKNIRVSIG